MLAQRAPGETAFGYVHQPTSMAVGLATRELADDRTFAGEIVRNLRRLSLVEFARVIQADSDLQG